MGAFTASNGRKILVGGNALELVGKSGLSALPIPTEEATALREFFQAEEDRRLGRWRWPENPDISVRALNERIIGVLRETPEGRAYGQFGRNDRSSDDPMSQAARAYFDAHPEPKPWHHAEEGEVWVFSTHEGVFPAFIESRLDHAGPVLTFDSETREYALTDPQITDGHCIWQPAPAE